MAFSVKDTQLTVRNEVNLQGGISVFSSVSQENYRWMVFFSKPRITSNSGLDFFLIQLRGKKQRENLPHLSLVVIAMEYWIKWQSSPSQHANKDHLRY